MDPHVAEMKKLASKLLSMISEMTNQSGAALQQKSFLSNKRKVKKRQAKRTMPSDDENLSSINVINEHSAES